LKCFAWPVAEAIAKAAKANGDDNAEFENAFRYDPELISRLLNSQIFKLLK